MPVMPALRRKKEENQKFKGTLSYIAIWKVAWAFETVSKFFPPRAHYCSFLSRCYLFLNISLPKSKPTFPILEAGESL